MFIVNILICPRLRDLDDMPLQINSRSLTMVSEIGYVYRHTRAHTHSHTYTRTYMHARTHDGKGVIMTIMVLVVLMMMDID